MGLILSATLVVGGAAIAASVLRRIPGVQPAETLRKLSPDAQAAIDAVCTRTYPWSGPEVALRTSDLFAILSNSRKMVAEADRLRANGIHYDELDKEHARVSYRAKRVSRQVTIALLERFGMRYFDLKSRYYQTAVAWYYSQQQHGLDFIADTAGIPLPETWEAKI